MQQILAHDLAKLPETDQMQDTMTLFSLRERHCISLWDVDTLTIAPAIYHQHQHHCTIR